MATGKQLIELAGQHVGEKYVLGATVPFENTGYKGPWGYAEFISWIVYQASGIRIGIKGNEFSINNWTNDASKLCKKISISEAAQTYGAILLRSPGYKGIGVGHIVFSDGKGGTIEAKSSQDNVCRSIIKGRPWEYGLLVDGIDYELNTAFEFDYTNPPFNFYVTSPVMRHSIVRDTKKKLAKLNIYHGTDDDIYDTEAAIAVSNYQKMKGLVADGVLGKDTLTSLNVTKYTTTEKNMLWFKETFEAKITPKLVNTPFDLALLMAIAYQETGYMWGRMIGKITLEDLLMCCTGDTIGSPGRKAFPRDRAQLEAHPNGDKMFAIARKALKNAGRFSATYDMEYKTKPDKFCRGYSLYQYDLQYFEENPGFFLNEEWGDADKVTDMAIGELKKSQRRIKSLKGKTSLSYREKVYVAIAYNQGGADVNMDFKQGHYNKSSKKYYGESLNDYYLIALGLV